MSLYYWLDVLGVVLQHILIEVKVAAAQVRK